MHGIIYILVSCGWSFKGGVTTMHVVIIIFTTTRISNTHNYHNQIKVLHAVLLSKSIQMQKR